MADARSEIGKALQDKLSPEQLKFLMDEILAIKKNAWGNCKECKHRVLVEIPDAKSVTDSMLNLMNQAYGRPDVAAGSDEERITFIREVRK